MLLQCREFIYASIYPKLPSLVYDDVWKRFMDGANGTGME